MPSWFKSKGKLHGCPLTHFYMHVKCINFDLYKSRNVLQTIFLVSQIHSCINHEFIFTLQKKKKKLQQREKLFSHIYQFIERQMQNSCG